MPGGNYTKMTGIPRICELSAAGFSELKGRGMQVPPPVAAKRHRFS